MNTSPAPKLLQRKTPAKRAFSGLIGSSFATADKPVASQSAPQNGIVTELVEQQLVDKKKRASEQDWRSYLEEEGWEAGDDQPVLVSSRARGRNSGPVRFQRYQFRLRLTGDRNTRWDRGTDPAIYGNMASSVHVRQSGMDAEGAQTADLHKQGGVVESDFNVDAKAKSGTVAPVSIGAVAQSMPKGFSTGVLSASLAYTDIPREPTPETAWVFSDQRLKFFVSRLISDDALHAFDMENPQSLKPFARALKAYVCLWFYFRVGKTSKATLSDPDLFRLRLWRTTNALKRYRVRVANQGLEMFGTPADPKLEFDDYDQGRVKFAWDAVTDLYRSKINPA